MKLFIYALRDKVANRYSSLALNESDDLQKRDFSFAVNNNQNLLFMAKDMELYAVGEFETETAAIVNYDANRFVCAADQLIGDKNG